MEKGGKEQMVGGLNCVQGMREKGKDARNEGLDGLVRE